MKYLKVQSTYLYAALVVLLFLLTTVQGNAQSITASTNAREIVKGEIFTVTFSFKNIQGGDFSPPDFSRSFVSIGGPSRSVSTTMMNGVVTREELLIYKLRPRRTGTLTIGTATLKNKDQVLQTQPLIIKVVDGRSASGEPEVFIRAEPSTQQAYVGQQILLDYKIYVTKTVKPSGILEESRYDGFWKEDIVRFNKQSIKEVINGVQYESKIVRRVALFPKQTGTLSIAPFSFQVGIPEPGSNNRGGLFGQRLKYIAVSTEPLDIEVLPLPDGAPTSFTGAIGTYQQITSLNPISLTTDDAITMQVSIIGDGDIKRVNAPAYDFPANFEVYDPKLIDEESYEAAGKILNKKVFEFLIVPNEAGTFEFQPVFTYFSPDSSKYITLNEKSYTINVRAGSNKKSSSLSGDITAGEDSEIEYLKLDTHLYAKKEAFHYAPVFWIMLFLPFFLLGGLWFFKQRQKEKSNIDPRLLRSKNAQREAARRLAKAEKYMAEGESRLFYDEISKAFLGYVCDRLQVPRSSLTKEGLEKRLKELDVSDPLVKDVMDVIKTSEVALFAGQGHHDAMQRIYDKSLKTLADIESVVKK